MALLHKLMALSSLTALLLPSRPALALFSSTCAARNSSFLSSLVSRRSVLAGPVLSTLQMATMASASPTQERVDQAIQLLDSVYGPATSPDFPRPMPSSEAGTCPCVWGASKESRIQRRYLWTDAFAVLAYHSLAEYYAGQGNGKEAKSYEGAVDRLIDVVHNCLGRPRSRRAEDSMTKSDVSPTGYAGLRIGKVETRKQTDYGMHYDGMYFHYVDKWLLALARTNRIEEGIRVAKGCFPFFFSSGRHGGGIRWKLSVDASPPPSLPPVYGPNDDTLNALIVFSMLEKENKSTELNLRDEIAALQTSLEGYRPRVTDDPLGWGIESLFDQYVEGHPRKRQLQRLAPEALHSSHLSLPFRLYGALIGALVVPSSTAGSVSAEYLQELLDLCVKHQFREMERESSSGGGYVEEHSSINRAMLAVALLSPGVLERRDSEPTVHI